MNNYDDKKGTPEAVLPVPEPGDLEKCQNVDFEVERGECKRLRKEFDDIKKRVHLITKDCTDDLKEPFEGKMNKFFDKAEEELKELTERVEDTAQKFVNCMKYYKYMPKKGKMEDVKPADFFSWWYLFSEDYKNSWKKEQV